MIWIWFDVCVLYVCAGNHWNCCACDGQMCVHLWLKTFQMPNTTFGERRDMQNSSGSFFLYFFLLSYGKIKNETIFSSGWFAFGYVCVCVCLHIFLILFLQFFFCCVGNAKDLQGFHIPAFFSIWKGPLSLSLHHSHSTHFRHSAIDIEIVYISTWKRAATIKIIACKCLDKGQLRGRTQASHLNNFEFRILFVSPQFFFVSRSYPDQPADTREGWKWRDWQASKERRRNNKNKKKWRKTQLWLLFRFAFCSHSFQRILL